MKNQKYNEERLKKYADHLKKGTVHCSELYKKLSHQHIGSKVIEDESLMQIYFLPIMELPFVFPNDWYFNEAILPFYKYNNEQETVSSVQKYFGLNRHLFTHLFAIGKQRIELYGGQELTLHPSFAELANNIEEMLEHLEYYSQINGTNFQIFLN
jgi:hypothetical protein